MSISVPVKGANIIRFCPIMLFLISAMMWSNMSLGAEVQMVGIFTDHCRQVFAQGEEIEVSVVVKTIEGFTGELELKMDGPNLGLTLAKKPVQLNANDNKTFSYRLRPEGTAVLKPSIYTLKASIGNMESRTFPIQIVTIKKDTHLVIYEANWSGILDYDALTERVPIDVWGYSSIFHNLAMDLSNVWGNVHPPLKNPFKVDDAERDQVPEEWLQDRDFMDLAFEELLKYGMGRVVQLHGVWCRTLRLGLEQNTRDYLHTYMTAVQDWKRYPNFLGLNYGDDLNTLGDWESGGSDTPHSDINFQERMRFWIADFAKKYPEFNVSRETLLPTNEKVWRAWIDYITEQFPKESSKWHKAIEEQMVNFITTSTNGGGYGMNIIAGNYLPKIYRNNTVIQTKTEADIGTGPFQAELAADSLSAGKSSQPVWVGSWGRFMEGTTTILQRAVSLLSRKLDGVGAFSLDGLDLRSKNEGFDAFRFSLGRRERNKIAGELCTRYGDLCLSLNLDKDVALLYSYSQGMFDGNLASWKAVFRTAEFNFNPNTANLNQSAVVSQAFADFTRAGYITKIVVEEDILYGRLPEYKALVLVGLTHPLPKQVMEKINEFQQGGGKVLVDAQTAIAIPGAIKLGLKFNQFSYLSWKERVKAFRAPVAEHETLHGLLYRIGMPNWPVIQEKLSFIKPFVTRDNPRVLFTTQSWGKGKYLFVVHDTVPPGWDANRFFLPNSQWIYPIQTQLKIEPGDYTVYDVFSQRRVSLKSEDGKQILPVDFKAIEGRIFAFLPAPIESISLKAPDEVSPGTLMPIEVQVLGPDRQTIDALISIEIKIFNEKGEKIHRVYRAAGGAKGYKEEFLVGVNEEPGKWMIEVKDLFSGHWAKKAVLVTNGKMGLSKNAIFEVPDVVVFNLSAIKKFVREGNTVKIALDDGQESYRIFTDMLCARLKAKGVNCEVSAMKDVITPNDWGKCITKEGRAERWHTTDLPDTDTNLILLSGSKPNQQIHALHQHDFCSRPLTANYPGNGKGIIDYIWSPFAGGFDVVTLVANDDEGLKKAVDQFNEMITGKVSSQVMESQTLAQNLETVRTCILPPKIAWREAPATWDVPLAKGKPSVDAIQNGLAPEDYVDVHLGSTIMALSVSPDSKYIVAGTNSYLDNLFLLNSEGKVLWARKIGPIFVEQVAVDNEGTVVASSLVDGTVQVYKYSGETFHKFTIPPVPANSGSPSIYTPFCLAAGKGNLVLNQRNTLECWTLDGRKLWEYQAPAEQKIFTMELSSPHTVLTLGCWNEDVINWKGKEPSAIENLSTLIQLDVKTGQEIWKVKGVVADTLSVMDDSNSIVTSGLGDVTLIDGNGKIVFKRAMPPVRAVVANRGKNIIVANCDGRTDKIVFDTNLYILDTSDGAVKTVPTGDVSGDIVVGHDGKFYAYSWDGLVYQFDIAGTVISTVQVGAGARLVTLGNGGLVAGNNAGFITRFDENGRILWQVRP